MATKKELWKEIDRLSKLSRDRFVALHEARHEIARMNHEIESERGLCNHASDYTINDNLKPRITMLDEFGKADTSLYPKPMYPRPKHSMTDDDRAPPEVLEVINKLIQTKTIKK